ncbi:phage regulatory CII family protein [Tsuneonella sp. HG094]
MPAARLKQAVRRAIAACGGIEGAAATVEKSTSHVGRWNSRNDGDLPTLGDALLLDEIAVMGGKVPAILSKLASELGHVCIRLPEALPGADAVTLAMIDASAEFGDVATALRDATADGAIRGGEPEAIVQQIDEAMASLARMRALLVTPAGVRAA